MDCRNNENLMLFLEPRYGLNPIYNIYSELIMDSAKGTFFKISKSFFFSKHIHYNTQMFDMQIKINVINQNIIKIHHNKLA